MPRQWGATGVTDFKPVDIDLNGREQIRSQLQSIDSTYKVPEDFYKSLGLAIARFNSGEALAAISSPAVVRKNLQAAIDAALALNERLNDLDGNSRQLLSSVDGGETSVLQDHHLWKIIRALSEADHLADEYPKKGRLPEHHRLWLAVDVANAIDVHVGAAPTTKVDGLFESILAIILEIATGHQVSSVHDLARRALKSRNLRDPIIAPAHSPPEDD